MSTTSVPHIVPILSLLEKGVAVGETPEPWESSEVGVDVVMYHLEAARTIAHHGGVYRTNAEAKLQGKLLALASRCCYESPPPPRRCLGAGVMRWRAWLHSGASIPRGPPLVLGWR